MLKEGVEPTLLSKTDPKSVASASFAIWAFVEVTGIEPVSAECKSAVLPLNYTP